LTLEYQRERLAAKQSDIPVTPGVFPVWNK